MKDPAIRACLLNNGARCDVEHLLGPHWLVLAQPGPAFALRGHIVKVKKPHAKEECLVAIEDLGKPH